MVGKGEEEVVSLDNIADGMSEMRPDKKKDIKDIDANGKKPKQKLKKSELK